jgi:hypothetical protein
MFTSKRVLFSLTEVTDPTKHREYNIWHQLDHRPENLALPGISWGERFVNSPDCARVRFHADPEFANLHYCNHYWFEEPLEQTKRDFHDLGETTRQLGRRPDIPISKRPLVDFFIPVKGYANPRVLVSPEALRFRPIRGIFFHLWEILEPDSADSEAMMVWHDQVHIPDWLSCPGVTGAWTFVREPAGSVAPGVSKPTSQRVDLYYLDEDPVEVVAGIVAREREWRSAGRLRDNARTRRDIYSGPFRTIVPWQWDWFDT